MKGRLLIFMLALLAIMGVVPAVLAEDKTAGVAVLRAKEIARQTDTVRTWVVVANDWSPIYHNGLLTIAREEDSEKIVDWLIYDDHSQYDVLTRLQSGNMVDFQFTSEPQTKSVNRPLRWLLLWRVLNTK
jgi:hypothetical protein